MRICHDKSGWILIFSYLDYYDLLKNISYVSKDFRKKAKLTSIYSKKMIFNNKLITIFKNIKNVIFSCIFDDDITPYIKCEIVSFLPNSNITDKSLKYFKNIKILSIYKCPNVTDIGLQYLNEIVELNLIEQNNISDEAFIYMKKLRILTLRKCDPDLIKGKYFSNIDSINIDKNHYIKLINNKKIKYNIIYNYD